MYCCLVRRLFLLLAVLVTSLVPIAAAQAAIPLGVHGDMARFDRLTGQRTVSGSSFLGWDQGRTWGKPYTFFLTTLGATPHIALKTDRGRGGGISPRGIALGQGDAHLLGLAQAIAESRRPVFLRPFAEMNNFKNPYSAFSANGRRRGSAYSTVWYRRAFQRVYILMHGGTAAAMSARLQALRMPGVSTDLPVNPYPRMTVIWNPLAVGEPDVPGNHYRNYFPGSRFVDAYGNNYFNTSGVYAFHRTLELYKAYPNKPFMFPEWGLTRDDPGYICAFAKFVRQHRRVRFIAFYNGLPGRAFDIGTKPRSRAAYRRCIVPLSR